jgi:hypothetical protein
MVALNHLMASISIITIMSTCEANVKINDQQQHHKTYEAYKSAKNSPAWEITRASTSTSVAH